MIIIINRHVCKTNYEKKKIAQHDCIFTRGKRFIFYQNYIIKTGLTRNTRLNALRMQLERTNSKTQRVAPATNSYTLISTVGDVMSNAIEHIMFAFLPRFTIVLQKANFFIDFLKNDFYVNSESPCKFFFIILYSRDL